jgi:hypothetical protein
MRDDGAGSQANDPIRIRVSDSWDRKYWAGHFKVTEARLREAVRAVGTSAEAVRRYLSGRG